MHVINLYDSVQSSPCQSRYNVLVIYSSMSLCKYIYVQPICPYVGTSMCTMSPFVLPICHVMSLGSYESNLLTNSQRLSLFLYPQRVTLCPFPIVHTLNLCPGQLKNTNAIQCSFFLCLYRQCDQIGRFLKVLGDMVSSKSSPNRYMVYFWAKAKSSIFNVKLL